jgi:hypothetical protein
MGISIMGVCLRRVDAWARFAQRAKVALALIKILRSGTVWQTATSKKDGNSASRGDVAFIALKKITTAMRRQLLRRSECSMGLMKCILGCWKQGNCY